MLEYRQIFIAISFLKEALPSIRRGFFIMSQTKIQLFLGNVYSFDYQI